MSYFNTQSRRLVIGVTSFVTCWLLISVNRVEADLVVEVESTSINAGGVGFVNVFINDPVGGGVSLAQYHFKITNEGSPASTLEFTIPQDFSENLLSDYLFASDLDSSGLTDFGLTSDSFIGSDLSLSGVNVPLGPSRLLLARLDVRHVLGPGQTVDQATSDQFRISLQNDADTFFEDDSLNQLVLDPSSFTGGLITIQNSPAAIPEPSSLILVLAGLPVIAARRYRFRRLASRVRS